MRKQMLLLWNSLNSNDVPNFKRIFGPHKALYFISAMSTEPRTDDNSHILWNIANGSMMIWKQNIKKKKKKKKNATNMITIGPTKDIERLLKQSKEGAVIQFENRHTPSWNKKWKLLSAITGLTTVHLDCCRISMF